MPQIAKFIEKIEDIDKEVLSLGEDDVNTEGHEDSLTVPIETKDGNKVYKTLCGKDARDFEEAMANEVRNNDFYHARPEDLSGDDAEAVNERTTEAIDGTNLSENVEQEPREKRAAEAASTGEEPTQKKIKTEVKEESDHAMTMEDAVAHAAFHPDIKDEVKLEVKQERS